MNFDELIKNINGTNTEDINELFEISVKVDNNSKNNILSVQTGSWKKVDCYDIKFMST